MKRFLLLSCISLLPLCAAEKGFVTLFNGTDMTGWKPNENPGSWTVKDGEMVSHGPRSHCFYVGDAHGHLFKDFELRADVMAEHNSNGGIYIETEFQPEGWPGKGFEIQVNNTYNSDPRKTGSIYEVKDVAEQLGQDGKWMSYDIVAKGDTITVKIDGKVAAAWSQPADWKGTSDFAERKIGAGTIALQAHDSGSTVHYKNIRIKVTD